MNKLAVIKTGGKQYLVKEGDVLKVEKLPDEVGKSFAFAEVLFLADGDKITVGAPLVNGAKVEAKVLEQGKNKKIRVVHYKPKTREHKVSGHKQPFTKVKIEKIS